MRFAYLFVLPAVRIFWYVLHERSVEAVTVVALVTNVTGRSAVGLLCKLNR